MKKKRNSKSVDICGYHMLFTAANSKCMLIYHQPKQSNAVKSSEDFKLKRNAKILTDYVIRKGMANYTDKNIYEYRFIIALEVELLFVRAYYSFMLGYTNKRNHLLSVKILCWRTPH